MSIIPILIPAMILTGIGVVIYAFIEAFILVLIASYQQRHGQWKHVSKVSVDKGVEFLWSVMAYYDEIDVGENFPTRPFYGGEIETEQLEQYDEEADHMEGQA